MAFELFRFTPDPILHFPFREPTSEEMFYMSARVSGFFSVHHFASLSNFVFL
jgi:hypothetical protein